MNYQEKINKQLTGIQIERNEAEEKRRKLENLTASYFSELKEFFNFVNTTYKPNPKLTKSIVTKLIDFNGEVKYDGGRAIFEICFCFGKETVTSIECILRLYDSSYLGSPNYNFYYRTNDGSNGLNSGCNKVETLINAIIYWHLTPAIDKGHILTNKKPTAKKTTLKNKNK